MCETVLQAVLARPKAAPIHVVSADSEAIEVLSRERLLERGAEVASALHARGVEPGDRVAVFLPNGRTFLEVLIGTWMCRAAIVPLALAGQKGREHLLRQRITAVLGVAAPRVIVGTEKAVALMAASGAAGRTHLMTEADIAGCRGGALPGNGADPDDLALIQFTSGSTGLPRGVPVRHSQIMANVGAFGRRSLATSSDLIASWLPLFHDMGFIGGLCGPLVWGAGLVLSSPERFMRNPATWLRTISDHRATLSPSPTFAVDLLARHVPEHRLEDVDLSSWRYAWVGAEPVFPEILERFEARFRARGLRPETLHPGYGLAEATLGVSAGPVDQPWRTMWVDAASLRERGVAEPTTPGQRGAVALVGNGPPLDTVELRVTNGDGLPIADGSVGRITVRGPSVMQAYFRMERGAGGADPDGWLDTGDLGFVHAGDVFVTGRAKDLIIRAGMNIAPQDVEAAVQSAPGMGQGCAVAFSCVRHETTREEIVVVAESHQTESNPAELTGAIRASVLADVGVQVDHVELVPPGTIPRTTSGKVQRLMSRDLFLNNALHTSTPQGEHAP